MATDDTEIPVPGVRAMDHTADVGLEIEAPDLEELFRRAALGMTHLLLERLPEDGSESRSVRVSSSDLSGLLREWLRALLRLHEDEAFAPSSFSTTELEAEGDGRADLRATLGGSAYEGAPVREIKGVTLHRLTVEERDGGWYGRVVFDV